MKSLKKTIIGALLLAALLAAAPAGATTCLCVGFGNGKYCGNGGMGGSFLKVNTVSALQIQYYLVTTDVRAQLTASGKAYDSKTGWFCWDGTLQ
ncbi:MAG: hypothetical protein M0009_17120 [Deltaproteobacteria bacterium]|nr:hypothetical protein [Deltaproteobacteria bacterium]